MRFIFTFILLSVFKSSKMTLDPKTIPVEKRTLFQPPLEEIADALRSGLPSNFQQVSVEVVDCPDLTQQPFTLANKGLGGNRKLVEIGGPPYLLPLVQRDKVYDLKDIANLVNSPTAFIIGAGAGPWPYAGVNCEGIYNLNIKNGTIDQHTRISKVDSEDNDSILEILPNTESRIALLGNLFFSDGEACKVIKVHVKTRIGSNDFIASIRKVLENRYKQQLVGLGGAFVLKQGKAKQHVMRDFSKTPINSDEKVNQWLKFYDMSAPLVAVGTLVNGDGGLDLRVQHFHSFSHHGEAGHYHIDTTPDTVEYLGYFTTGTEIYRVDKPVSTHKIGRD